LPTLADLFASSSAACVPWNVSCGGMSVTLQQLDYLAVKAVRINRKLTKLLQLTGHAGD
jgi:hypothetical protein